MDVLKSELDSLYSKTHTRTHNLYQLNTIKLKGDINYSLSLFKQSIGKYYSQLTIHKNHEQQLRIKISNILLIHGCYELQGKRYSRLYALARSHDTFIAVHLDQLYKHLPPSTTQRSILQHTHPFTDSSIHRLVQSLGNHLCLLWMCLWTVLRTGRRNVASVRMWWVKQSASSKEPTI